MIPMKQTIYYKEVTKVDEEGKPLRDEFGREKFEEESKFSKARVLYKVNKISRNDGSFYNANVVIDIPSHVDLKKDAKIKFKDVKGHVHEGVILEVDEVTNLMGNRVHYRTLIVDG